MRIHPIIWFPLLLIIPLFVLALNIFYNVQEPRVLGASTPIEKPVLVIEDGIENYYLSQESDFEKICQSLGIKLYPEDKVLVFMSPDLGVGTKIEITRAIPVTLNNGGKVSIVRTFQPTIRDLLKEKNIELFGLDKIKPKMATVISKGMKIIITRVEQETTTETENIPYQTVYQDDSSMYIGESKVAQEGQNGKKELTYQLVYENGGLVDKILKSENIIKEPQNKIVYQGTKSGITTTCNYNSTVEDAASKYGLDPNSLCYCMMIESNGNYNSYNPSGPYYGLFQYSYGTWLSFSWQAGYAGADIYNPTAQIYTTAWAWANGYRGRWPSC